MRKTTNHANSILLCENVNIKKLGTSCIKYLHQQQRSHNLFDGELSNLKNNPNYHHDDSYLLLL